MSVWRSYAARQYTRRPVHWTPNFSDVLDYSDFFLAPGHTKLKISDILGRAVRYIYFFYFPSISQASNHAFWGVSMLSCLFTFSSCSLKTSADIVCWNIHWLKAYTTWLAASLPPFPSQFECTVCLCSLCLPCFSHVFPSLVSRSSCRAVETWKLHSVACIWRHWLCCYKTLFPEFEGTSLLCARRHST